MTINCDQIASVSPSAISTEKADQAIAFIRYIIDKLEKCDGKRSSLVELLCECEQSDWWHEFGWHTNRQTRSVALIGTDCTQLAPFITIQMAQVVQGIKDSISALATSPERAQPLKQADRLVTLRRPDWLTNNVPVARNEVAQLECDTDSGIHSATSVSVSDRGRIHSGGSISQSLESTSCTLNDYSMNGSLNLFDLSRDFQPTEDSWNDSVFVDRKAQDTNIKLNLTNRHVIDNTNGQICTEFIIQDANEQSVPLRSDADEMDNAHTQSECVVRHRPYEHSLLCDPVHIQTQLLATHTEAEQITHSRTSTATPDSPTPSRTLPPVSNQCGTATPDSPTPSHTLPPVSNQCGTATPDSPTPSHTLPPVSNQCGTATPDSPTPSRTLPPVSNQCGTATPDSPTPSRTLPPVSNQCSTVLLEAAREQVAVAVGCNSAPVITSLHSQPASFKKWWLYCTCVLLLLLWLVLWLNAHYMYCEQPCDSSSCSHNNNHWPSLFKDSAPPPV